MMARNAIPEVTAEELDAVTDQDEVPQLDNAALVKKSRKVKLTTE